MDKEMRIGGHISASGGLSQALARARSIGANTIQIFGSSPRQWMAKLPGEEEAKEFRALSLEMDIKPIFLHAPYLINLASATSDLRRKSEGLLKINLEIAEAIGAEGVILHLGSSKGGNPDESRGYLVKSVLRILAGVSGRSKLLLENSAGGGDKLGSTLSDLSQILESIGSNERVGVCFDTAHALEAGVLRDYNLNSLEVLEKEMGRLIGWRNIGCLHVNDSKTAFGSHHDRHENIGQGQIGLIGFQNLMSVKNFRVMPWILEVPGFDGSGPDARNIDILRDMKAKIGV